ncbi:Thioesterase superfamily member 4 [Balamuthia mandrillaris]
MEGISAATMEDAPGFAQVPYYHELMQSKEYVPTSWAQDFPLLSDPDVQKETGVRGRTFASGSITKALFWSETQQKLVGLVKFGIDCEGPPGSTHGGAIATILDASLGYCVNHLVGLGCVTLNLDTTYKKLIPLGSTVRIECWKEKIEGRKVFVKGRLTDVEQGETVHSEASALFYMLQENQPSWRDAMRMFGRESNITKEQFLRALRARRKKKEEAEAATREQKEPQSSKARL